MLKLIVFILVLFLTGWKFYSHRKLFKELTKRDWLQYIGGFMTAWIVAVLIIIGGEKIVNKVQISWLNNMLAIVLILLGLFAGGYIINKTIPQKIRQFYF